MDLVILDFVREHFQSGAADAAARVVSFLGGAVIWLIIAGVLCFFKDYRVWGIALASAVLLSAMLSEFALKPFIMRERPFITHGFPLIVKAPYGSSFPSSHTAQSFAGAVTLFGARRLWGGYAVIFAAGVGLSRIYLMVHYPSDVLAGAVLGAAVGIAAVFAVKRGVKL
ncbi:MAG: phosphatase PAP2 family protein [Oscillospiraceae bacterium]|jgi:undecaprenyl-diphosphatase|nr:phosphatase PAP2 family protein [Oscillospiraceae bacterium]